jgi:hypothetical protein
VIELRAIGSLANLASSALSQVLESPSLLEQFLDLCEQYDMTISPGGPGTKQRAGLLAVARR